MLKALEVIGLPGLGQVQLRLKTGEETSSSSPVPFSSAIDQSLSREMSWYFQDYLNDPFGASQARARQTEASLRSLGREMFEAVFRGNPEAASLYATAVTEGLNSYVLAIVSDDPSFLDLPWELLNCPGRGLPGRPLLVPRAPGDPAAILTSTLHYLQSS